MNRVLAISTIIMTSIVAMIVTATLLRKWYADVREERFEAAKLAVRPAVFELVASDGVERQSLEITMGMSSGRGSLALRRRAVNLLLVGFTQQLRGEVVTNIRKFLIDAGFADDARRNLRGRSAWKRAIAAQELGYLADTDSVVPLIRLLQDRDASVRIAAVRALGVIGDTRAAAPLLGTRDGRRQAPYGPVSDAVLSLGPGAIPAVVQGLYHPSFRVRRLAIDVLGELGVTTVTDDLVRILRNDRDTLVRIRAANALGRVATGNILADLYDSLRQENDDIRGSIVRAISGIGSRGSLAVLRRALSDPDHRTARIAASSLAELGPSGMAVLRATAAGRDGAALYALEAIDSISPVSESDRLRVLAGLGDTTEQNFPTTGVTAR